VIISLSATAAAPLLCEIGCFSPQRTSQPCHDADSRTRVAAANHACDHSADDASLSGPALKLDRLTRDSQAAESHLFVDRGTVAVSPRHPHGPPGAAHSTSVAVRAVLRI
jgi:hypothetical protein